MFRKYALLALWGLSIPLYLWSGTLPDRYAADVLHSPRSYPTGDIIEWIAITGIESVILYAILRPASYRASWKRAGAALLLFFPWLLLSAVLLVHQPAFLLVHFLWVVLFNLLLVALCAAALLGRLGRFWRG